MGIIVSAQGLGSFITLYEFQEQYIILRPQKSHGLAPSTYLSQAVKTSAFSCLPILFTGMLVMITFTGSKYFGWLA